MVRNTYRFVISLLLVLIGTCLWLFLPANSLAQCGNCICGALNPNACINTDCGSGYSCNSCGSGCYTCCETGQMIPPTATPPPPPPAGTPTPTTPGGGGGLIPSLTPVPTTACSINCSHLVDDGVSSSIVAALAGSVNRRDLAANAAGSRNRLEQIHWNNLRPTVLVCGDTASSCSSDADCSAPHTCNLSSGRCQLCTNPGTACCGYCVPQGWGCSGSTCEYFKSCKAWQGSTLLWHCAAICSSSAIRCSHPLWYPPPLPRLTPSPIAVRMPSL